MGNEGEGAAEQFAGLDVEGSAAGEGEFAGKGDVEGLFLEVIAGAASAFEIGGHGRQFFRLGGIDGGEDFGDVGSVGITEGVVAQFHAIDIHGSADLFDLSEDAGVTAGDDEGVVGGQSGIDLALDVLVVFQEVLEVFGVEVFEDDVLDGGRRLNENDGSDGSDVEVGLDESDDFIDGGLLAKGSDVVRIDPVDYELALSSAESSLEKARFDHKLELGRQDVARREWELLKTDDATEQEKELALRIPHLVASKASLKAAESALEKAQLDLERTRVRAPFDGVVLERGVNLGSQALPQDMLARLAGTGAYWVVVSIPVDRLGWVEVPGSGGRVVSASGAVREGRVLELLGELEEKGRMARLLVEVDDPLCLKPENKEHQPLLLGEYVRVEISGRELQAVYAIPRNALRENRQIWIATREGTLDIREVDVLWRGAEEVLIRDGLSDGDQLIVSDMTAPVQGMDVNTGKRPAKDRPGRPPVSKE